MNVKLPSLTWHRSVKTFEESVHLLCDACHHFLDEICPSAEVADIRFSSKEESTRGLISGLIIQEKEYATNIYNMASLYTKIQHECPEKDFNLAHVVDDLCVESKIKALLLNVEIPNEAAVEGIISLNAKFDPFENPVDLKSTTEATKFNKLYQLPSLSDIMKGLKTSACTGNSCDCHILSDKLNIKPSLTEKNNKLLNPLKAFLFASKNKGSLIYIPVRGEWQEKGSKLRGGLYLYNLSGGKIKIKKDVLDYLIPLVSLLGGHQDIVLHTSEVTLTDWKNRGPIFKKWEEKLKILIEKNHDLNKKNMSDIQKSLNEMIHYKDMCKCSSFTKVDSPAKYERIKFIKSNQASFSGLIVSLYERFKCDGYQLNLRINMEKKCYSTFDAIDQALNKIVPEWYKKRLSSVLGGNPVLELNLDDEIAIVDAIYLFSMTGNKAAVNADVTLNIEVNQIRRKMDIYITGHNISTPEPYPYLWGYDTRDMKRSAEEGVGGSTCLLKPLFESGKWYVYNLYASRFLYPMLKTNDGQLLNSEVTIHDTTKKSIKNWYDWDPSLKKANFKLSFRIGNR